MQEGMTLRDYFAAKAMQSALPLFDECNPEGRTADWAGHLAGYSYIIADAMLAARQSKPPTE